MIRVYVDHDGVSYRVHDTIFGVPPSKPFKHVRVPIGDPRATVRCFKPEAGPMRVYQFTKGEGREVNEAALLKQFRSAGVQGTADPSFNPQANRFR